MISRLEKVCSLFAVQNSGLFTPFDYIAISVEKFFRVIALMPATSICEIQGKLDVFTRHVCISFFALH
jgi:hypothetical protein